MLLLAGYRAGDSGGVIVYQYEAGGAYADSAGGRLGESAVAASMGSGVNGGESDDEGDDDADDDDDDQNPPATAIMARATDAASGAVAGTAADGFTTPVLQGKPITPLP